MLVPATTKKIEVVCPICKTRDLIGIPEKKIRNSSHLTTVSIQKGLICPHHFQIFIDKNLQVRGYQKVDFELNHDNSKQLRNGVKVFNKKEEKKGKYFENIIHDSNSIKTASPQNEFYVKKSDSKAERIINPKEATLKEIYEEFWEFIDEDNEKFQMFIRNDKKRKKLSIDLNRNENYNHLEINQEI
ncbi:MAG: hypothetical protein KGD65_09410 [Candidatus Lokiarchaeota archaeon]|nr:hypothetical protein [Candidatus Lokiarchaeota archaeon]